MAQVQTRNVDTPDQPVADIDIRFSEGINSSDAAIFNYQTDGAGNQTFPVPYWPAQLYTLHANQPYVNGAPNDRYDSRFTSESLQVSPDTNGAFADAVIYLKRKPIALDRLHVENHDFIDAQGRRVFLRGATCFLLYKRFLDGEDITPVLRQLVALGVNCVRVIGMVSSFSHWFPQDYGDRYYDEIVTFCWLLESYGLYVYWTVFADTQIVMPGVGPQVEHLDRVVAKLQLCPNTLGELVNEAWAHDNATDNPYAFNRPQGVVFSAGSFNDKYAGAKQGLPSPQPWWDFDDFHTPRNDENEEGANVKDQCMSDNPNYKQGRLLLSGEPDKFGRPDPNGKARHTDPNLARRMAGTARGTTGGIFFHTNAGIMAVPLEEAYNELACARAWFGELV